MNRRGSFLNGLFNRDEFWLLNCFRNFFWHLKGEDSVFERGLNVILGYIVAHIETPVAASGVTLFADAVAFCVFFFFRLVPGCGDGQISVF